MSSFYRFSLYTCILLFITSLSLAQSTQDAVQLDGINDFVAVPLLWNNPTEFTVEAWIYPTVQDSVSRMVFDHEWDGAMQAYVMNGEFGFGVLLSDMNWYSGKCPVVANRWTHIAMTWKKGSGLEMYIDGALKESISLVDKNLSLHDPGAQFPPSIGSYAQGQWDHLNPGHYFKGMIDEVRVWSVARTEEQIRLWMHHPLTESPAELLAYYQFDGAGGGIVNDASGHNQTATLTNGAVIATSLAAIGSGHSSGTVVSSTGSYRFVNEALFAKWIVKTGVDTFTIAHVLKSPPGTQPSGVSTVAPQYWIIHKNGSGSFSADMTFGLGAGAISLDDLEDPSRLILYRRELNGTGTWSLVGTALKATFGSVTFIEIADEGEYAIGTTGSSTLYGANGIFQSVTSTDWSDPATWQLIGGSDDDGRPDANDDVILSDGFTVHTTAYEGVNNLFFEGAAAGTRLSVDGANLSVYGIFNSDATVLSSLLITTNNNAVINIAGLGRTLFGHYWSPTTMGWSLYISSIADTLFVPTGLKVGSLSLSSAILKIGSYDNPQDLYLDWGEPSTGVLSVDYSTLIVTGNIARTSSLTSPFQVATVGNSTLEIGGTYLNATSMEIGYGRSGGYWYYYYPTTFRVRSANGLYIGGTYSQLGTLEYIGTVAQNSGNELQTNHRAISILNSAGVQFLTTTTVQTLELESGNLSVGPTATLTAGTVIANTYEIHGSGDVTVTNVTTGHSNGIDGTFQTAGAVALDIGGEYVFDGSVAQVTGSKMPTIAGSLKVSNSLGLTLSGSVSANSVTLESGGILVSSPYILETHRFTANTFEITGNGQFILRSYGSLETKHMNGIDGSIQTKSIDFLTPEGLSVTFDGTVPQSSGLNMPSVLSSFNLQNPSGLTISKSLEVPAVNLEAFTGDITLPAGVTFTARYLTVGTNRKMSGDGNFVLGANSGLIIGHPLGLEGAVQLMGTYTFIGGPSVTMNGTSAQVTGSAFPDTILGFNISNPVSVTLSKAVNSVNTLMLSAGQLDNSLHNLKMEKDGMIIRSNGTIVQEPLFDQSCNISYDASIATGPEMPASSTILSNLTSGYWITLAKNVTANGTISCHINTDTFALRQVGSYVAGYTIGNLIRPIPSTGTFGWTFSLPVSLTVDALGSAGEITGAVIDTTVKKPTGSLEGMKTLKSFYRFGQTGISGLSGQMTFAYNESEVYEAGIPDEDSLKILQWRDSKWIEKTVLSRDRNNNTITIGGVDTMSDFIVTGTLQKGTLALSRDSISFGTLKFGQVAIDTIYVKNVGHWALNVSYIYGTYSGFPPEITRDPASMIIPVGDSIAVQIKFAPVSYTGEHRVGIVFVNNGDSGSETLYVRGQAVEANFSPSAWSYNFGEIPIGTTKRDSVYIANNGTYPLIICHITATDSQFVMISDTATIQMDEGKYFVFEFKPASEGAKSGNFIFDTNINSGGGTAQYQISVSGSAAASMFAVFPQIIDFGTISQGSTKTDSVRVTNAGAAKLFISSVSPTSQNFAVKIDSLIIDPGDTDWVYVTFNPQSSGAHDGYVVFNHTAVSSPDSLYVKGTSVEPVASFNKLEISFGNVLAGNYKKDSVIVSNTGSAELTVTSALIADTTQYSVIPAGVTLQPGKSQSFIVTFHPTRMGSINSTLTFSHNAGSKSTGISLKGNGLSPVLSLSRTSIAFGEMRIDSVKVDTITVSNTGNESLIISTVTSNDPQFSASPGSVIIAAGNKVIFAVSFKPAQRGIQQHRILFAYNSLKSPDSVQVVGTGIEPLFATTRDSVPFGKVRVSKEKVDSILITNNGNMALTVSSVISTNPNFSLLTSGLSVPSDESRPFVIKFSPATSGVKNGKIIFNHDAKSSPDTIAVSGTGVEPLFLATKKQLDFGEVRKNTSTMQTLLIKNPGSMELTIHRVNTQTTNYSAMPTNVIIGAGDSASFTVTFKPQSRGIINEYLVFQHDASSVSDTVFLSGVGTEPLFSLSRSKIDYKGVRINQIKLDSFYIRNPGNTQLTISSIEVPVGEFKVRPLVGAVMQQDSMFFQTEFQPFTTGPKSVTVLIHHNASAIPDTLLLSGTGIEPLYVMTPRSLKFGDVLVKTAKADTITISNPGTDTLHFSEIFLSDSMYQITPAVKTLAPAGTHKCIVTFKPVAAADRPAVIVFKHDAKTSPDSLYLSGRGVEPLFAFDKDSIKFGKVLVGQSRLDSVIVRNDGTSVLTIVSVAPIDTINFAVAPEMAAVQPGGKQTFIITFAPKTGGLRSTMMVFAHNARQGRDSLTISGQGLEAMTIAQARKMPSGTEVVIEGIVTRAKGTATRLQDTTAGIAIFHPAGVFHDSVNTGGITSGDLIRIVGRISEQEYLKRFTDVDISSFERLARDKTLPKPVLVTLKELGKNGELYESQLVTISGLQLVNTNDTLFAPLKNYAMIDSSDTSKLVSLSIGKPVDTDIDSTKCPKGTFTFLGVVGQVHPADSSRGYQLVPIYDGDIKADPTDIKDQMLAVIPDRYILFHNFPNPFNPSTTIRFGLPVRSSVLLEIYNIVGQRIDILVNEEKEAGYYDVHWLADVPSGVYFYRIESSAVGEKSKKFIEVRKMLLLK